jgi:predicted kinase
VKLFNFLKSEDQAVDNVEPQQSLDESIENISSMVSEKKGENVDMDGVMFEGEDEANPYSEFFEEVEQRISDLEQSQEEFQERTEQRLDDVEDKLDRLLKNQDATDNQLEEVSEVLVELARLHE